MGSFNRDHKGGGGKNNRNFGKKGRNFFGGNGFNKHFTDKKPFMHDAVCAKCGKDCQVPFKPSGGRPIFCSNCFDKSGNDEMQFSKGNFNRPRFENNKQMFEATCVACGDKCQVPFKPSAGKPVFCSNCFEKKNAPDNGLNELKDQLASLHAKLDLILKNLTANQQIQVPIVEVPKKEKKKIKNESVTEKTNKKSSLKKKK